MARRRGKRGEGSVYYSRADRSWVARWPLGVVDGKRQSRRAKRSTRAGALEELEKFRRLYGRGGEPARGTLDDYLRDWIAHRDDIAPTTRRSYVGHINHHISPLLGGIRLADLAPSDVRRLVAELKRKGRKPGTVHLVIRTLASALQDAVDERSLTDNATRGVKLPRLDREPVRPLTGKDADAILAAVEGSWIERPVRVWLGSGMRRGEVIGLDQGDLHLTEGYVSVRHAKRGPRAVPISADASDALRDALAAAPRHGVDQPVFFGRRRPLRYERMSPDSISHALPRLLQAAGLARLTPHALRHGAATLMLTGGASMRTIAEQLGHRNPALTARVYAHVVPEAQRDAVRHLERREAR